MGGFTKLFSSIIDSTIWRESLETKVVWITMLAKADGNGYIHASVPGLADAARVSIDQCETSLELLRSPDKYSRTTDFDGRRIMDVDGGWLLLNHKKYRSIPDEFTIRSQTAERVRNYRAKLAVHENTNKPVTLVTPSNAIAEAEAEAKEILPLTPPGKVRTKPKPELDCSPEVEPDIRKVYSAWPKESPDGSPAKKGAFALAARAYQKIVTSGEATSLELRGCGVLYAQADTYPPELRRRIYEAWDHRDHAVMHVSTFYGPEKRPYRQLLSLARELISESAENKIARENA